MMTIKTLCIILLLATGFIACKKENEKKVIPHDRLLGKWRLDSTVVNDYYSGAPHKQTFTWAAEDYLDFRNNGKIYTNESRSYDTIPFGIISDFKIWIDTPGDIFDIKLLTETSLELYIKYLHGPEDYSESTVSLKR